MTSKAERRRRKGRTALVAGAQTCASMAARPGSSGKLCDLIGDTAPAWQADPRERVRRLPAFMALELCGAITRQHREAGDLFAARYRMALEHAPAVVASYGSRGGHDVDEERQDAARRWIRAAIRRCPAPSLPLLLALARRRHWR